MPRALDLSSNPKQDLFGALQGYYATIVLLQLHRLGVLGRLEQQSPPEAIAKEIGADPAMLKQLLDFLALTTGVVQRTRKGAFKLSDPHYPELSFHLEKFAGAYGRAVAAIAKTLLNPDNRAKQVDRRALAAAFSSTKPFRGSLAADLIAASGVNCLLDLGCGPASLLVELADRNPNFYGIGMDSSRSMCVQARRAVRLAGLDRQIDILHADAGKPGQRLSRSLRTRVEGVYGGSFLNEFFGQGDLTVVKTLRALSRTFPGRRAWFLDYYSSIGQTMREGESASFPLALLQDLSQIVSGQGVPPPNAATWRKLYQRAGCKLRKVHEFESTSIRWFIQEVTL